MWYVRKENEMSGKESQMMEDRAEKGPKMIPLPSYNGKSSVNTTVGGSL